MGTATLMILGDKCTRACSFCNVTTGKPTEFDVFEPFRAAEAIHQMNLKHAVITSVNRDDLDDGGAGIFADTIRESRRRSPGTEIEVLIPDFKGDREALQTVMDAGARGAQPQHRDRAPTATRHPDFGQLRTLTFSALEGEADESGGAHQVGADRGDG